MIGWTFQPIINKKRESIKKVAVAGWLNLIGSRNGWPVIWAYHFDFYFIWLHWRGSLFYLLIIIFIILLALFHFSSLSSCYDYFYHFDDYDVMMLKKKNEKKLIIYLKVYDLYFRSKFVDTKVPNFWLNYLVIFINSTIIASSSPFSSPFGSTHAKTR